MNAAELKEEDKALQLWYKYKLHRSIELRNEIVLQYTGLVKKIVLRFKGSYSNFGQLDDMVNQGIIALIDAVEKFDPDMGNKFETFASLKIRGSVIDFMRKQDWVPRNQRNLAKELDDVYQELYTSYGHEPTKQEIADRMRITSVHLEKILEQRHNSIILSYEEAINEKMMVAAPLIINDSDVNSPEAGLLYNEMKEKLIEVIGQLNEKERLVISLYYYENLKLREIAEVMSITESRVSQIHSAAVIKMKNKLIHY
ncbi:MAG: FliA/WhiG family RNA polymerase sigma factor [Eubacteriales bacterium]|nr:FliA/WhiG family RNA polymerase sigma factor [Eubacteriales bacterium]MDD3199267.1 FliA/WhiG family RNA polymerase sigma factor [Eubacteriales bacterium]MDD4629397.1 FliA/WhiG family RNA polymerase sigma factor [Eubacteriales bacterium]